MRELPTPTLPLASIFETRRLPRAEETVTAQHRLQVTWARTDEELREGIGMGLTLDELADHLEMSEDAVVARCEQLGLRPQGS